MPKLTPSVVDGILSAYEAGERLAEIQKRYGISRTTIHDVRKALALPVRDLSELRKCSHCGEELRVRRSRLRTERSYCSQACYLGRIREVGSGYHEWRHGTRLARDVVWGFYPLAEGNIVHHIDGDQSNNDPANLMVFRSHSEHMRWHRAGLEASGVIPLWRGDKATL